MGIPYYFHTITQTHKGILHLAKPAQCNHYFFDYNGAIHHAAQAVLKDETLAHDDLEPVILDELWEYTQKCVSVAAPSDTIGIYVDGVAPVAKIHQQRKRRYLSIYRHRLLNTKPTWDTNAISPGTAFMTRMHAFIRNKIRNENAYTKYTFSTSLDPGEGEHKIFAHISCLPKDDVVFIHGLDADLIMLSLISHRAHIYLMREPSYPYTPESTEDGFVYLEIDALRSAILKHLHTEFKWNISAETIAEPYGLDAQTIIETYVVLCFLLGNDFLPHGPTLTLKSNGYERILRAGKEAMELWTHGCVLMSEKRLFLPFLSFVLQKIAEDENSLLWKANEDYMKRKPSPRVDAADSYPLQPGKKDKLASLIYSSGQPAKWRALYYKHLFFSRMHDTRIISQACNEYITGICWTYAYYKRLPKPNMWAYPYGYPPSLLDIANYLQGSLDEWDQTQETWKEKFKRPEFLDPAVQLLCILPKESHHILPPKVRTFTTNHTLGLVYLYPTDYEIQTYMHTHLWECTPVLPALDIAWIQECVKDI